MLENRFICWTTLMIFLVFFSCHRTDQKNESTPTTGIIRIACDEMLKGIVMQEEDIFERNYPNAAITIDYLPESQLFEVFLKDTVELIIASRGLDSIEKKFLDQQKNLHPREFPMAVSAIALVAKAGIADSTIGYSELLDIIRGSENTRIKTLVVEKTRSGIPGYLMSLAGVKALPGNFYAKDSLRAIIDYVNTHPEAIGLVDWSQLSDSDDPIARLLLDRVTLMSLENPSDSLKGKFYQPYQYNLQDRLYPLTRTLTFITRSGKNDLGLGFASFITGDIGQKILLKAGLLPLYQTDRWIEIHSTGDFRVVQ
ncbi:MAG: substrate-binding domain-containing protein [Saprospiraceae bacterium]